MDIKVTTENVVIDQESLNKGEYNIRECNFELAEEFTVLVCKALFTVRETNLTYQQDIVNSKCTIPYETTEQKGIVEVGVIGYEVNDEELIKRYSPAPDVFFVIDGSYIEDIENQSTPTPTEIEQLEQRVSQVEIDAAQVEINTQDISDIKQEQTTQNNDILLRSLITETGSQIELSLNSTNFKMTATLKDKNGTVINTSNEIDLPLESVVVNASYDSTTKEIILTLQNGNTVRFSVADLVSGLVSDTDYATISKGGVIKTNNALGTQIYSADGILRGTTRTYSQYQSEGTTMFISKGTLENVITGKQLINQTQLDASQATQDTAIQTLQTDLANKQDKSSLVTGTGTEVTLNNTAEMEFIQPPLPRGNSEQVQYSGKNKLPFTNQDFTVNGVRYYVQNGILYLDGTSSGETPTTNGNFKNNFSFTLESGTYVFSRLTTTIPFRISKKSNDEELMLISGTTEIKTFTLTETTEVYLGIYVYNKTFNNQPFLIQLEEGSTATSYEPYVGGTASPNPSYPQPITNVTGDVEVLVQNKNYFDLNKILYGEIDSNGDLSLYAATRDFYKIDFKENTQYTISGYVKRTSGNVRLRCMYTDGTYSEFFNPAASDNFSFSSFTSLANKTIDKIVVYYGSAGYLYIKDGEMQIEENTTATTYTPHQEQTFTFPLGSQRMYLGDYLADDGIHSKRDIDIFDGSDDEVWALIDAYFVSPYVENVAKGTVNSICNIATIKTLASLSATDINKYAVQTIPNGRSRFYFRCSQFGTLDDWKAYLAENPITVEYELAEEEITPYTTEQQQVYDEIKQAISYEEQTNISGSSDEVNPLFEVQAVEYKEPDYWTIAYVNTQIGNAIGGAY